MLDVKKFAYEMLEEAKENFQRDRILVPVGFLLGVDGTVEIQELDLRTEETRHSSMKAFQQEAREQKAVATITIQDTEFVAYPPWEEDNSASEDGKTPQWLEEALANGSGRCVSMDIDVPGQTTINVMVPYSKSESGEIKFEKPEEGPVDFNGTEAPNSRSYFKTLRKTIMKQAI